MPCPLCANHRSFLPVQVTDRDDHIRGYGSIYAGKRSSEWKICGECGFVHQNPRPTIAALNHYYAQGKYHPPGERDFDALMAWAPDYYGEEVRWAIRHSGLDRGRVFDIGCGYGVALHLFEQLGWSAFGVEPDATQHAFAQTRFGLENVKNGVLDENIVLAEKVDLVFTHHAFEHFADLSGVMAGIAKILKPGGYVFTAVPTYFENRTNMSKQWMNSAHYSLFTHRSLNQLMARHGFEEVRHRYDHSWRKPDQFCHLARFTRAAADPKSFYERPEEVDRYLRVTNPLRSAFYYPRYGELPERALDLARYVGGAASLLLTSPREFYRRARARL
ncbi:MAG TPA: class I SAM-dependent methyltransferase [Polyangia bacterium]